MVTLCAGTPSITVRDNRGLDVRSLRYNRSADGDVATQYVDAQTHSVLGQPASSQDPRFFNTETLNFQYTPALSGQVLRTVSVDAGTAKACADIAGQPIWQHSQGRDCNKQSDNNITVQLYYDALGRPLQRNLVTSDVTTAGPRSDTSDIWCYGDYSEPAGAAYDPADSTDPRNANQRGQLFQHFDTAGLIDMSAQGYAVQGVALRQDRRFQATACDAVTHWQPALPPALYDSNKQWLEPGTDPNNLYSTRWAYNALAQALTQVDAKGHQQQTAYDCAGRKCATLVTPKGGTLTPVTTAITYNATGAIDTRSDANNIQVVYAYEPQTTQRLISITTSRIAAPSNAAESLSKQHLAGKNSKSIRDKSAQASAIQAQTSTTALQALTYAYDGVGNVTALADSSAGAPVSFFRNRAVTPDRGYTYDALYQLTSATGRENYVNNTPKGTDWPGGQFNPTNTPDYQTYTRSYTYDPGGNLTTIRSSNWSGAAPPTRQLVVGSTSNRAVCTANNPGPTQANIDTYFDLAGKSICLDANRNQPMYWTAFHQLYCVVTAYRPLTSGTATADWSNSDREQYAYDGSGQRARKYASSMANGTWNYVDTRYLPGLELRDNTTTGENLEVIVLDDGARLLNWAGGTGKPGDIPNLQLRYQYADRQNSCQIEADKDGNIITQEEYYPFGGTAVLASRSNSEVKYKYIRYSGKERDATGLYYYGLRYYQPWIGRWINPDPAGTVDGQNLYRMVRNNPVTLKDRDGLKADPNLAQGQVQELAPIRPKLPNYLTFQQITPLEAGVGWRASNALGPHWSGLPGATLIIRKRDGSAPPLFHESEQQAKDGKSPFDAMGRMSHAMNARRKSTGLTEMRSVAHAYGTIRRGASTSPASYSLPTVTLNGEERRLSFETYLYVVLPLLFRNTSNSPENTFENVARYTFVNLRDAQNLAEQATLKLVAARTVQKDPQWQLYRESDPMQQLLSQVTAAYKDFGKGHTFEQRQELLFEHLQDPDKRAGVLARVKNAGAPADSTQASSSRAAAPASATWASSSRKRKEATNPVRDIEVIQLDDDEVIQLDDDESPVSKRQPLPEPLQPATERLSAPSTSMQAQESLSVHNPHAASTSQASGFSHMPSLTAMPAQQASTSSAVLHNQPLPQRQQVQLSEQNPNSRTPSPFPDFGLADFNDLLTPEEMLWVEQAQGNLQPFGQQNPKSRTPSPFAEFGLADFNDLLTPEEMLWVEQAQVELQPFGQQNPNSRTPSPHF